ncbi:MAG: ABC transporter ATP-binding protein [Parvibaculaceae bacterium]
MESPPALRISNLSAGYGKLSVLHGVSLSVAKGSMTALLGPNGAGKTTLAKSIVRLVTVFGGEVWYGDKSLNGREPQDVVGLGIGFVPQTSAVFASLSVHENLEISCGAMSKAEQGWRIAEAYDRFPRLSQRTRQRASTLSGGERQMLAIGSALLARPSFLILDEPTTGLSPQLTDEVVEGLGDLRRGGTTLLWIVEQNPQQALALADWAVVMEAGAVRHQQRAADLLNAPNFRQLFLGV